MNDQTQAIDLSKLPPSDTLIAKYIALRDKKESRLKAFMEGGLTDDDEEAITAIRQLAGAPPNTMVICESDVELLTYMANRLEALLVAQKSYDDAMTAIEGIMHMVIKAQGPKAKSIATENGTAFFKQTLKVAVKDRMALHAWILENPVRMAFVTNHIVKEEVEKQLDIAGEDGKPLNIPPPGVEAEWIDRVQFRKP